MASEKLELDAKKSEAENQEGEELSTCQISSLITSLAATVGALICVVYGVQKLSYLEGRTDELSSRTIKTLDRIDSLNQTLQDIKQEKSNLEKQLEDLKKEVKQLREINNEQEEGKRYHVPKGADKWPS